MPQDLRTEYNKVCKELSMVEIQLYHLRDAESHISEEEYPVLMSKMGNLEEEIEGIKNRACEEGVVLTGPSNTNISQPRVPLSLVTCPEL